MVGKKGGKLTIASSGTAPTEYAFIGDHKHVGFTIPTLTTAICYLRVANNQHGTGSQRVQKEDGSADLNLASGAGGKYWQIQMPISAQYVAVETSAAQGVERTIYWDAK